MKNLLLHLSLINGIGPAVIKHLLAAVQPDKFVQLYNFTVDDFVRIGVRPKQANELVTGLADQQLLIVEQKLLHRFQISFISIIDQEYPELLKHIHLPPTILYVQGSLLTEHTKCLAVIGSRKANDYGNMVIKHMIVELVAYNWSIVSGGAIGADTMAHQATLDAGGKTIVILGSGLLQPYPSSNNRLFNRVLAKGGTLVSPFSLQTKAMPGNFPARNRIISGVSKGCVVVQAAQKSGARITAQYALEQGRDVFAVPGSIVDPLHAGCHALIQEGAKLTTCAYDVLVEYEQISSRSEDSNMENEQKVKKIEHIHQKSEHPILKHCSKPISIDELLQKTELEITQLQAQLFELQLEGKVEQNFMGLWTRM